MTGFLLNTAPPVVVFRRHDTTALLSSRPSAFSVFSVGLIVPPSTANHFMSFVDGVAGDAEVAHFRIPGARKMDSVFCAEALSAHNPL